MFIHCPPLSAIFMLCCRDREIWRRFKTFLFRDTTVIIFYLNDKHDKLSTTFIIFLHIKQRRQKAGENLEK